MDNKEMLEALKRDPSYNSKAEALKYKQIYDGKTLLKMHAENAHYDTIEEV